jgi:hypothetical protein
MDTDKPSKTFADYLVIAISPVLIIVLVHSICFFLVDIFFQGEALGGVRWVLFWFVLAIVLIARIGIEQGPGHAMGYGLALAGVSWIYVSSVLLNPVFAALLLGLLWFTAHQLTCNCTLIDEDDDASGQGLIQSLQRLPRWFQKQLPTPAAESAAPPAILPHATSTKKQVKKAAAPGIWLIYYSLAALPIFGLGQTLLPAGDRSARHRGLVYLFCYLAAAMGLLVTTSFLGLRRYLRQRYVAMPDNLAFGWVRLGILGAALVLCLALLLPRPGAGEAWGALRYHVDNQIRRASEYAAKFNPHGTGKGRAGDAAQPASQPGSAGPPSGEAANPDPNASPSAGNHGTEPSGGNADQGTASGGEHGNRPGMPALSAPASAIYPWIKLLFYLVGLLVVGWLLYRYRISILAAARSLLAALRHFIATLMGKFRPPPPALPAIAKTDQLPPFKAFKNPFLTGGDHLWAPEELIVYSYAALQSWALEAASPAGSPRTPREFCRELGEELPEAAPALEHLAFLYGHVAYGATVPGSFNREHLRLIWQYLARPRPQLPKTEAGAAPLSSINTQ